MDGKGWIQVWDQSKWGLQSEGLMLRDIEMLITAGATKFQFEYLLDGNTSTSFVEFEKGALMSPVEGSSPSKEHEGDYYRFEFKGCMYLDFTENYDAKRQALHDGSLFWLRDQTQNPSMVQFCTKKGRLGGCGSCKSKDLAICSSYLEVTHKVRVPKTEIDS